LRDEIETDLDHDSAELADAAEPTYPGLTYAGTWRGQPVYVGDEAAVRAFNPGDTSCAIWGPVVDRDFMEASRGPIAVTSAVLANMDTWVTWSHRVTASQYWTYTGVAADVAPSPPITAAEPAAGLGFWNAPPRPDTRSTEILAIEAGRVVLHLDETETHTGLLEGQDDRSRQWTTAIETTVGWDLDCPGAAQSVFVTPFLRARRIDRLGWPVDRQALHDAVARLNLALDWKDAGKKGASDGE